MPPAHPQVPAGAYVFFKNYFRPEFVSIRVSVGAKSPMLFGETHTGTLVTNTDTALVGTTRPAACPGPPTVWPGHFFLQAPNDKAARWLGERFMIGATLSEGEQILDYRTSYRLVSMVLFADKVGHPCLAP